MGDFVALTCPSCGGQLEITSEVDRFACAHCGTEHVVRRGGGIVSLAPVVASIQRVQSAVDKTASELAIGRLVMELQALKAERQRIAESPGKFGWGPYLLALAIGSTLCLVGALVSTEGARTLACILMFLGGGVVAAGVIVGTRKQRAKNLAAIDAYIAKKREELRRHREIVSG